MKESLKSLVVAGCIAVTGCGDLDLENAESTGRQIETTKKAASDVLGDTVNLEEQVPPLRSIEVGVENFEELVDYIEERGFVVSERGIPCDYQYTFFDSKGNRHAMIAIKRDASGHPSMEGIVDQISVFAYYEGVKDQEHFFGYLINKEEVKPYSYNRDGTWKEKNDVESSYYEFLEKVRAGNQ